jgi:hypothetical protein
MFADASVVAFQMTFGSDWFFAVNADFVTLPFTVINIGK